MASGDAGATSGSQEPSGLWSVVKKVRLRRQQQSNDYQQNSFLASEGTVEVNTKDDIEMNESPPRPDNPKRMQPDQNEGTGRQSEAKPGQPKKPRILNEPHPEKSAPANVLLPSVPVPSANGVALKVQPSPEKCALRVDNLVRPLKEQSLRLLLGETGHILEFWLSPTKTHCYVAYESQGEAAATKAAVDGKIWPLGGKALTVKFTTFAEVRAAVACKNQHDPVRPLTAIVPLTHAFLAKAPSHYLATAHQPAAMAQLLPGHREQEIPAPDAAQLCENDFLEEAGNFFHKPTPAEAEAMDNLAVIPRESRTRLDYMSTVFIPSHLENSVGCFLAYLACSRWFPLYYDDLKDCFCEDFVESDFCEKAKSTFNSVFFHIKRSGLVRQSAKTLTWSPVVKLFDSYPSPATARWWQSLVLSQSPVHQILMQDQVPDKVLQKPKAPLGRYSCALCNVRCSGPGNLDSHFKGSRHRQTVLKHRGSEAIPSSTSNTPSPRTKLSPGGDADMDMREPDNCEDGRGLIVRRPLLVGGAFAAKRIVQTRLGGIPGGRHVYTLQLETLQRQSRHVQKEAQEAAALWRGAHLSEDDGTNQRLRNDTWEMEIRCRDEEVEDRVASWHNGYAKAFPGSSHRQGTEGEEREDGSDGRRGGGKYVSRESIGSRLGGDRNGERSGSPPQTWASGKLDANGRAIGKSQVSESRGFANEQRAREVEQDPAQERWDGWQSTDMDKECRTGQNMGGLKPRPGGKKATPGGRREVASAAAEAFWEKDKEGMFISRLFAVRAGKLAQVDINEVLIENFTICNKSQVTRTLQKCRPVPPAYELALRWSDYGRWVPCGGIAATSSDAPLELPPGTTLAGCVRLVPSSVGLIRAVLLFDFGQFQIGRRVEVLVHDESARSLEPSAPFKPHPAHLGPPPPPLLKIVKLEGFHRLPDFKGILQLPEYRVPDGIRQAKVNDVREDLQLPLTVEHYRRKMHLLLYVEEMQMEVDIQYYSMNNVALKEGGNKQYFRLSIPGLTENRPALGIGEALHLTRAPAADVEYEAVIFDVQEGEVVVRLSGTFRAQHQPSHRYNVRFSLNRAFIRRCHLAVDMLGPSLAHILLPDVALIPDVESHYGAGVPDFKLFEPSVNEEQLAAVEKILSRSKLDESGHSPGPMPPFLIIGPPGTGKTRTTVEAILQVLCHFPQARVLACAPSNSAADGLLERLHAHFNQSPSLDPRELHRICAPQRRPWGINSRLLEAHMSFNDSERAFVVLETKALRKFRCIVTACSTAALLHLRGLQRGHFSHIFIDEAGHAPEPECLIPAACFLDHRTIFTLAGDPSQLGPVVRSTLAADAGLGLSYLERIMHLKPYREGLGEGKDEDAGLGFRAPYDPAVMTKLVKNYRSHPEILKVPNMLFYSGQLECCADKAAREALARWRELPNHGGDFPLLFHGVIGEDLQEGSSPSFFNPSEASEVKKYISKLRDLREAHVTLNEIGVLTPYRKQAKKIQRLLAGCGYEAVKVGSAEDFQGQERRVIIISTVRSNQDLLDFDKRHNLGFLLNPRRFNVAVTRAMQLLIVIGNPHILAQDVCWSTLLTHCYINGAYRGCSLPRQIEEGIAALSTDERDIKLYTSLGSRRAYVEGEGGEKVPSGSFSMKSLMEDPEWQDSGL